MIRGFAAMNDPTGTQKAHQAKIELLRPMDPPRIMIRCGCCNTDGIRPIRMRCKGQESLQGIPQSGALDDPKGILVRLGASSFCLSGKDLGNNGYQDIKSYSRIIRTGKSRIKCCIPSRTDVLTQAAMIGCRPAATPPRAGHPARTVWREGLVPSPRRDAHLDIRLHKRLMAHLREKRVGAWKC